MNTSKIIRGVVSNGRYTVTAPIVKEDYGLYLKIEGVELPSTYEVDFSNSENSGSSVTMIGNSDGVLIPHQFISTGKDVFAFLYHVGEDFGRTVYKFRIPNKVRPDRTDDTPTPEQASVIDQAISALNTAVAQTAQDKADADASAQSASADADRAEEARTDAQNFATQAEQSATDAHESASQASASATASANSASQSAQIKAEVESLAEDAQASADLSGLSARSSGEYASQAQGFANNASASAQSASGYANNAQSYSQTASAKAQDASGYAQTASQKATESAQSATNASQSAQTAEQAKTASQTAQGLAESARDSAISAKNDAEQAKADAESARDEAQNIVDGISGALADKVDVITDTASGSIASFPDGADGLPLKSLVVDINPVQDLHGQDAPYPAGGGVNLLPFENVFQEGWTFTQDGITATYSKGYMRVTGTNALNAWNNIVLNRDVWRNSRYEFGAGDYAIPDKLTITMSVDGGDDGNKSGIISAGTSVSVRGFYISVRALETVDWNIPMVFVRGSVIPTVFSPYENICPISGWTNVDVEQSGKNVWDEEWELGTFTANHEWGTGSYLGAKNPVRVVPNVTYYNVCPSGVLFVFYNNNGEYIGEQAVASNSTFTAPSGASTMRFRTFQAYGNTYNHDISINYPSTDHDYHPYTGRSITIDLGQTVYGGKLDVLSGELVVDMAMMDLGTLSNWWKAGTNNADTYRYTSNGIMNTVKKPSTSSIQANIVCSSFKTITGDMAYLRYDGVGITKSGDISIYDSRYDKPENTTTEFKEAMNGVMLCYELATPIEIQLAPNQINSLYGVNNIWADSGDTEAEYRADTKLYISKKIAEALASLT